MWVEPSWAGAFQLLSWNRAVDFFLCTYSLFSSFSFFLAFTNFWTRISVIFHYKKTSWNKSEKNAKSSKIAREIRKKSDCQTLAIFRFLSRKLFPRAEGRMSQAESIQAENPSARLQLITKLNIYNLENEPKSSNILIFGSKFGFRDHFMIELIPHTTYFRQLDFPIEMWFGYWWFRSYTRI